MVNLRAVAIQGESHPRSGSQLPWPKRRPPGRRKADNSYRVQVTLHGGSYSYHLRTAKEKDKPDEHDEPEIRAGPGGCRQ